MKAVVTTKLLCDAFRYTGIRRNEFDGVDRLCRQLLSGNNSS